MNKLLDFKRKAKLNNLCAEYSEMWDKAESKADLVKLATTSEGAVYMADAEAFDWGLSQDYLCELLKGFINGDYIVEQDGYTSEMFVAHRGRIEARTTLLLLLGCNCTIYIPENHICRIIVARSSINIEGKGKAEIESFKNKDNLIIIDEDNYHNVSFTEHNKSNWA